MQMYLFVVVCAANLVLQTGNLCSASQTYLSAYTYRDGSLSSWDNPQYSSYIWIISAPYGQKVLLNFDRLHIPSYYCQSYLTVRDGQFSSSRLLTKQCGLVSTPPSPIYSSGRHLRVNFQSWDYYSSNAGISAKFRALSDSTTYCPDVLEGNNTGVIYSPGFPFKYPESKVCSWIVITKSTYLLLNFTVFDLESGCCDNVVVRDGQYSWSSKLGEYLPDNSEAPFVVTPSGDAARIKFTSDVSNVDKGFLMFYRFLDSPYAPSPSPPPTLYPAWHTITSSWTRTPHLDSRRRTLAIVLPIVFGIVLLVIIILIILCEKKKRATNTAAAPAVNFMRPVEDFPLLPSTASPAQQRVLFVPTSTVETSPNASAIAAPTAPPISTDSSSHEPRVEISGLSSGAEMTQSLPVHPTE